MSLGQNLKHEREHREWSQKYVADKLGITNTVLSNYERDYRRPDPDTLSRLASLFDVSVDYLLGRTSDTQVNKDPIDDELKKLMEDPDFMVAYKEMPGTPEEAKEDLIGFMRLLKERHERKKNK